jgi:hypothetical protein
MSSGVKVQDPHITDVDQFKMWYNPSLKVSKHTSAFINFRNVQYPNITSYSSKAITAECSLVNSNTTNYDNISYVSLAFGINVDNASDNLMSASTLMCDISYALPVSGNNTYIALGVQTNYSFNKLGIPGYPVHFPDKFDQFGALGWSIRMDPYSFGYNKGYFTAGLGISAFQDKENDPWYIGASILYFNHPYTEWSYTNQLPTVFGLQGGYTIPLSAASLLSLFANFSWQKDTIAATRQFVELGGNDMFSIDDSTTINIFMGIGFRFHDAIVPDIGLRFKKHQLVASYEFHAPNTESKDFERRAYSVLYRLTW